MNVSFANDPIALRRLIAYEALGKVPVFQAYKNMCRRIGGNVMTYPDYEFWYWRFVQGEMNLNYERRETPKKLLELPLEMLLSIFENFTPMERLIMRKVSRMVRSCIDSMDPKISRIDFTSKRDQETTIDYKTFNIRYQGNTDCLVTSIWMQSLKSILIRNTSRSELALNDLSIVLGNPKLHLESLDIRSDAEKLKGLQPYLQSLGHKIRVEKVEITTEDSIEETMILSYLKPESLKAIKIRMNDYCLREGRPRLGTEVCMERLERLSKMVQCQKTKMLTIYSIIHKDFPIEYFANCRGLTLHHRWWSRSTIPDGTYLYYLEVVLKSTVMKEFSIDNDSFVELKKAIRNGGNPLWNAVETGNDTGVFKIPIANSERVFKLDLNRSMIQLTRQ